MKHNLIISIDEELLCLLQTIIHKENRIMATMQEILDHLSVQSGVEDQVLEALHTAKAANDPSQFQTIVDAIDANTHKLSDAIVTPAPEPVPAPV